MCVSVCVGGGSWGCMCVKMYEGLCVSVCVCVTN